MVKHESSPEFNFELAKEHRPSVARYNDSSLSWKKNAQKMKRK
jgi:hypothetical protein